MKCDQTLKAVGYMKCPEQCATPTTGFVGTVDSVLCLNDVVTIDFKTGTQVQIKGDECPEWIKPGARIKVEFNSEGATIQLLQK